MNNKIIVMSTQYEKLKTVVWGEVACTGVHKRYMWWIVIHSGERWYSQYSELLEIEVPVLTTLKMATRVAPKQVGDRYPLKLHP
jgi:hypothetical protein